LGAGQRNEWVHDTKWDCVILDEYHYGAWRENAKGLFGADEEDSGEVAGEVTKDEQDFDESILPITTGHYLYLSGTPFRALASGEFIEEQIYNWTYSDEQRAKRDWKGTGPNLYAALPRLVLLTYTLPDDIRQVAEEGEFNEFDLNEFFFAEGESDKAKFEHEDEVQKWLDLIRGAYRGTTVDDLKLGKDRPPLPFSDARLLGVLQHSFWFLPSVAACYAMANLLKAKQNTFYHDYNVVIAAGSRAGVGAAALPPRPAERRRRRRARSASYRAWPDRSGFSRFFSPPSGALVMAPSSDCHPHWMPFNASYSSNPAFQSLRNTPRFTQC
jgi:hypothetical protein